MCMAPKGAPDQRWGVVSVRMPVLAAFVHTRQTWVFVCVCVCVESRRGGEWGSHCQDTTTAERAGAGRGLV